MSEVTIIGAGYVGLCTGVVFAKHGHRVRIVDVLPQKVEAIRRGEAPFYEPGLQEALREALALGRLEATTDLADAVQRSGFVFLCVGTPQGADGASDLSYIRKAAADVGAALRAHPGFCVVVTKSTVPPGTAEDVVTPELEKASGTPEGDSYAVASNPEFLKEGSAMKDALEPDRIVVGARRPDVADHVLTLYSAFSCPKLAVDTRTAETIKYAANAFLAVKIAFSNEMANVCERIGVDWYDVATGIGHDARIGPLFLRAGCGFGGSCFPKDVAAIAHVGERVGAPSGILRAVLEHNDRQPLETVRMLREELGELAGKRVALLGLAFKPDTDDVRETRARPILRALLDEGADVVCHDPQANRTFRALVDGRAKLVDTCDEALEGADGAIVQTEWSLYRECPPETFARLMRKPVVIDGRRTFDPARMAAAGVRYRAIGLGTRSPPAAPPRRERATQRLA
jgi:UDPglucose 6-dehydrogenase